jgi:hypothetical protein
MYLHFNLNIINYDELPTYITMLTRFRFNENHIKNVKHVKIALTHAESATEYPYETAFFAQCPD